MKKLSNGPFTRGCVICQTVFELEKPDSEVWWCSDACMGELHRRREQAAKEELDLYIANKKGSLVVGDNLGKTEADLARAWMGALQGQHEAGEALVPEARTVVAAIDPEGVPVSLDIAARLVRVAQDTNGSPAAAPVIRLAQEYLDAVLYHMEEENDGTDDLSPDPEVVRLAAEAPTEHPTEAPLRPEDETGGEGDEEDPQGHPAHGL